MNLADRAAATQRTLDKFRDRPFDWKTGDHCVKLLHWHLKAMGRKPQTLPRIRSALAAKRELKRRKVETVSGLLDTMLPRIAPASMLVGDVVTVPGEGGLDAVMVCAGPFKFIGWVEDHPGLSVAEVKIADVEGAWRV